MTARHRGPAPRQAAAGFSLVEVVVALGLLAGVLISISGLFVLANRQLDGGRNHSIALSVARDVLEEMDGWGFRQIYSTFGFDGTAARATPWTRGPTRYAARVAGRRWNAELSESHAEIVIESAVDSGPGPSLRDARAIRVRDHRALDRRPPHRARSSLATLRV